MKVRVEGAVKQIYKASLMGIEPTGIGTYVVGVFLLFYVLWIFPIPLTMEKYVKSKDSLWELPPALL